MKLYPNSDVVTIIIDSIEKIAEPVLLSGASAAQKNAINAKIDDYLSTDSLTYRIPECRKWYRFLAEVLLVPLSIQYKGGAIMDPFDRMTKLRSIVDGSWIYSHDIIVSGLRHGCIYLSTSDTKLLAEANKGE